MTHGGSCSAVKMQLPRFRCLNSLAYWRCIWRKANQGKRTSYCIMRLPLRRSSRVFPSSTESFPGLQAQRAGFQSIIGDVLAPKMSVCIRSPNQAHNLSNILVSYNRKTSHTCPRAQHSITRQVHSRFPQVHGSSSSNCTLATLSPTFAHIPWSSAPAVPLPS